MRDESAGLHRKAKSLRCGCAPADESRSFGQAIERIVHLHGPEPTRIVGQPRPLPNGRRIEHPLAPMRIIPPTCSDEQTPSNRTTLLWCRKASSDIQVETSCSLNIAKCSLIVNGKASDFRKCLTRPQRGHIFEKHRPKQHEVEGSLRTQRPLASKQAAARRGIPKRSHA